MATVGVVHPGSMGSALARALVDTGHDVAYVSAGRSERTRQRAAACGLRDAGDLGNLVTTCDTIVSICPPGAASQVAAEIAAAGFAGTYLDANATAPATATEIGTVIERAGGSFVDGSVIGPATFERARTHLLLAGTRAGEVADLFDRRPATLVLDAPPGTASAVKACYAAWTKGTSGLLIAIRALATHAGVADELHRLWATRDDELEQRSSEAVAKASTHGWRWDGEMEQIARAFADAGLPDGFHRAAAEVFATFPRRDEQETVPSDELLSRIQAR